MHNSPQITLLKCFLKVSGILRASQWYKNFYEKPYYNESYLRKKTTKVAKVKRMYYSFICNTDCEHW